MVVIKGQEDNGITS